jgi:hypothetical protein
LLDGGNPVLVVLGENSHDAGTLFHASLNSEDLLIQLVVHFLDDGSPVLVVLGENSRDAGTLFLASLNSEDLLIQLVVHFLDDGSHVLVVLGENSHDAGALFHASLNVEDLLIQLVVHLIRHASDLSADFSMVLWLRLHAVQKHDCLNEKKPSIQLVVKEGTDSRTNHFRV